MDDSAGRGFTTEELLRRDLMDSTDFGESIRQVGGFSAAAEYFAGNKNDEMDFRVKGGNITVVEALEKAIAPAWFLNPFTQRSKKNSPAIALP